MRYMFGHTWEIPGAEWEKFECELDEDDWKALCEELRIPSGARPGLTLSLKHLMMRTYGRKIEATEKFARGYMSAADKKAILEECAVHLEACVKRLEGSVSVE